jgi:hypothetical protein
LTWLLTENILGFLNRKEGCGYWRHSLEISFPREISDFGGLCLAKQKPTQALHLFLIVSLEAHSFEARKLETRALEGNYVASRLGPFHESTKRNSAWRDVPT